MKAVLTPIASVLCAITVAVFTACTTGDKARPAPSAETPADVVALLSDDIVANPNNAELYVKRAMAYADRNMYDLAHRDVDRAMAIDSTVAAHHAARGELFFRNRELRDARISFEKAVQLDPASTETILKLAEVNFLLRRYPEALRTVDDALLLNERLPKAYFIKGFIFRENGDTALALSSFQTATEINPEYFDAYMELGYLHAAVADPIAVEYFQTALEIKPSSSEAFYHLGMFYQSTGNTEDAMKVYRKMVKADPNSFLGYYNMGYIYLTEAGDFKTAIALFDSVLTIQPAYLDALYNKGLCYEELGDARTAEAVYREVLENDPQHTLAAMGLERLLE